MTGRVMSYFDYGKLVCTVIFRWRGVEEGVRMGASEVGEGAGEGRGEEGEVRQITASFI